MEPFSFDFCPRLEEMLASGQVTAANGRQIPIQGASSRNNLQTIRKLMLALRPRRTLEVGLAHGASALTFVVSLREVNEESFSHVAIDPFQTANWKGAALRAVADEGLADHFHHYEEESCTVLPRLYHEQARFDMIYIDGSHLFEDAFLDFYFAVRLANLGGIVLFDDCMDKHVRKVIRFIDANYGTILRKYPLGDFVRKPIMKRAANRCGFGQLRAYSKIAEPPRAWNAPFAAF